MNCIKFDYLPVGTSLPADFTDQQFEFTNLGNLPTTVRKDDVEIGIRILSTGLKIVLKEEANKTTIKIFIGDGGPIVFKILDKNNLELGKKNISGHGVLIESLTANGIKTILLEKSPNKMEETLISICISQHL